MPQILDFSAVADRYKPEDYILLMPQVTRTIDQDFPMWSLDVAVVNIDPDNDNMVYPVKTKRKQDKSGEWYDHPESVALQKPALDLLCAAGDIATMAEPAKENTDARIVYKAVAAMNNPSGGLRPAVRTRIWKASVERQDCMDQAISTIDFYIKKKWKGCTAANRDEKIDAEFRKRWIKEQRDAEAKTESKAIARAVRALVGLQSNFKPEELRKKQFAIIKFSFTPDTSDPDIKRMVVMAGLQAQRQVFGPAAIDGLAALLLDAPQPTAGALAAGESGPQAAEATVTDAAPASVNEATGEIDPEVAGISKVELMQKLEAATVPDHVDNIVGKYRLAPEAGDWFIAAAEDRKQTLRAEFAARREGPHPAEGEAMPDPTLQSGPWSTEEATAALPILSMHAARMTDEENGDKVRTYLQTICDPLDPAKLHKLARDINCDEALERVNVMREGK